MSEPEELGEPFQVQVLGLSSGDGAEGTQSPEGDWGALLLSGAKVGGAFAATLNCVPAKTVHSVPIRSTLMPSSTSLLAAEELAGGAEQAEAGKHGEPFLLLDLPRLTTVVGLRSQALRGLPLEVFYSRDTMATALLRQSWVPYTVNGTTDQAAGETCVRIPE